MCRYTLRVKSIRVNFRQKSIRIGFGLKMICPKYSRISLGFQLANLSLSSFFISNLKFALYPTCTILVIDPSPFFIFFISSYKSQIDQTSNDILYFIHTRWMIYDLWSMIYDKILFLFARGVLFPLQRSSLLKYHYMLEPLFLLWVYMYLVPRVVSETSGNSVMSDDNWSWL